MKISAITPVWFITILLTAFSSAQELGKTKAAYQKADRELNIIYAKAKKTLDKEQFAELKDDQKDWLHFRDRHAEFQAAGKPLDTSIAYWDLMKGYTEERVDFIKAWINVKPSDAWEGVYKDGYGGMLTITKKDGKLVFEINVVRGASFHVGEIDGTLDTNKDRARFSDKGKSEAHDPGEKTWLDFTQIDGVKIQVAGTNTSPYHGARAYFDGIYRRMK